MASSRTRPSSVRAWAISPSAAERAARMSQSVVSPSAETTTRERTRGGHDEIEHMRAAAPGVPREVPPNL
jgi:hypothetical protein